ncbi:MAG: hypothetical protein ACKPKO_27255, partial [Candidatus Fonsibacter sp.]
QPHIRLQQILDLPTRAAREVVSVLPLRRKVVRQDAMDIEVPAYLWDMVEDVIHRLSYLFVGYDVDVVEDAHRLIELLDLNRVRVEHVVELYPFWLDLVEALVRRETEEPVYGSALELVNVLLKILTGICALTRAGWTGDVENLSLLGGIGYVLELAVAGCTELSKLINETVLVFVVGVARKVVRYADYHPFVFFRILSWRGVVLPY